jgi:nitrite reductase (NO-forming)
VSGARTTIRWYQAAARRWLTAAALSLLLPEGDRLGLWLPLHLALAGAVSVAIAGAMQNFALALTAAPAPAGLLVAAQFGLLNTGVLLLAVRHPTGTTWAVQVGGGAFVASAALLGWLVVRARRIGLNQRHQLPIAMYLAAVAAVLVGGTLGALLGTGLIPARNWAAARHAHLTLNVLGWASFTIAGTLVTLLPTVLRIRMPDWHGTATGVALVTGVAAMALGLGVDVAPLAAAGGAGIAVGSLGVAWMAVLALRTPRRWPVPVAAKHLVTALAWFVVGSVALPFVLAGGAASFARHREVFLAVFVAGWVLQTLLGAWQYLLPMARPGHPDDRRRQLGAIELGATLQVLAYNAGVLLLVLGGGGWIGRLATSIGAWLALGGGALALLKAWAFGPLGRVPALAKRQLDVWGA